MMKKILTILLSLILINCSFKAEASDEITYSRILLKTPDKTVFKQLAQNDIYIDHMAKAKNGYVVVFNNKELEQISALKIPYEILIEDLEKHHEKRIAKEMKDPAMQRAMKTQSAQTPGFGFGSHAGYYTPTEMVAKLDEISMTYPNIAAGKVNIGSTYEGRDIYMLKISDNPNTDESATEPAVYYDAMHHAREPLSMMTTMYYMFWLVDNYGSDPEATHIVNNRELFFVPIVNIDGYEYNITTNPNGGGFWRKNRRPDVGGSGCIGTDPNRNYGADWGGSGASTSPCSDTYRGDGPFSEPCTQAVRDLLISINPVMAFSNHSYSEIYIESDWNAASVEEYYADYSLDICEEHDFGYEQGESLLYAVSGATTEYLNSLGAISYTPEIGSVFWEPMNQIVPYAEKHLPSFIYIALVAGDYADIKQATINNGNDILPGQNYNIDVEVFNKGRTQPANNVTVQVVNQSANVTVLTGSTSINTIAARQTAWSTSAISIAVSNSAANGDIVEVELSVTANGIEYERETQRWIVGTQNVLFAEDGSNGLGGFNSSGTGLAWDASFEMKRSGNECITDSPLQAANNNTNSFLTMSAPVNLSGTIAPTLEYWIAWGVSNLNTFSFDDPFDDHVKIEIRQNGGAWNAINTDDTQNVNGGNVEFRFVMDASDFSEPDGVFIDDFRIVDYSSSSALPVAVINNSTTIEICEGETVTVGHSSTNYSAVLWSSGDGASSNSNSTTFTYNNVGVYTLTLEASNANGSDVATITVIVNAATPVTMGGLPSTNSSLQPVNLSATPAGGVFTGNGVIFNAFNPALTGAGSHTITYTYTNADGCVSSTSTDILVFTITFNFVNYNLGTINPKIINSLDFEIEVPAKDRYSFNVFDLNGRPVYQESLILQQGIQQRKIDLDETLLPGMYFIQVKNSDSIETRKFIR